MPHLQALAITITALLLAVSSPPSLASTAIVPDDFTTIQAGIDSRADTVRIRAGSYDEHVVLDTSIVLEGVEGEARPVLNGILIHRPTTDPRPMGWHVRRCNISGRVNFGGLQNGSRVGFSECVIDSGLFRRGGDFTHAFYLTIIDCRLGGPIQAIASTFHMERDTIDAGVSVVSGDEAIILDCWFRGGPGRALEVFGDDLAGTIAISRNTISGYGTGIFTYDDDVTVVESNIVSGCGTGIHLPSAYDATVRNNTVTDCGVGIDVGADFMAIVGNTVLRALDCGVRLDFPDLNSLVSGNAIGHSGGTGLFVYRQSGPLRLEHNTIFGNIGSGIEVVTRFEGLLSVRNNISYGNRGWGLAVDPSQPVTMECNDWFMNEHGAVNGTMTSASDLQIDPLFCDVEGANVTLMANSPLLDAAGCGLIGALGVGCGATPVLVALLRAEANADGIRIEWEWGGLERPASLWIERAGDSSGPWARIATDRHEDGEITVDLDREIEAGHSYVYRLAWIAENGDLSWSEPITATAFGPARFALESITPNPSSGPVEIAWSLPRAGDADIAIFDIAGREVARLANGLFAAGNHRTAWNGVTLSRSTAPGLYFVRLRYDGRETTRRILLRR